MSCYVKDTKHPETGIVERAHWIDDYYGIHQYGVKFADGKVFRESEVECHEQEAPKEVPKLSDLIGIFKDCPFDPREPLPQSIVDSAKAVGSLPASEMEGLGPNARDKIHALLDEIERHPT